MKIEENFLQEVADAKLIYVELVECITILPMRELKMFACTLTQ